MPSTQSVHRTSPVDASCKMPSTQSVHRTTAVDASCKMPSTQSVHRTSPVDASADRVKCLQHNLYTGPQKWAHRVKCLQRNHLYTATQQQMHRVAVNGTSVLELTAETLQTKRPNTGRIKTCWLDRMPLARDWTWCNGAPAFLTGQCVVATHGRLTLPTGAWDLNNNVTYSSVRLTYAAWERF
jgi:hypothetical protein